jgi:competence protein ComEC
VAGGFARLLWPLGILAGARGLLFPWVPVFIGIGIAIWFALPFEPGLTLYAAIAAIGFAALLTYRLGPELGHPLAVIVLCLTAGMLAAGYRAHAVHAPMLEFRYYGPVQGRIIEIDRSQSDALRITMDQVALLDVPPDHTPLKVRISLHGEAFTPDPGQVVLLTAHLSAPEGPAEPGGFDFRRMAYFEQLGAVGYTSSPVVLWAEAAPGTQRINRLRTRLAAAMMAAMPGDAGAFAAGAMTGDRSGISQDTVQALRDSNLAHLLAISGMNMAFITGFVFMLVRYGAALIPPLALRINSKKLAAVVAFAVALFYLQLSGANVATTRAFLMVVVMLGAVLLDRRGLTMRSVALAGVVLLLAEPESLGEPGFQLSFAATVVLIAGFEALDRQVLRERLPRWLMPVFTMVLTSVLAGMATAPYAAATFNRFTDYGLLANLLTVPSMSILMAAGAMAALLAPFGLAAPAYWLMEASSRWILFVAHWVAGLDGSVTPIIAPGPLVIPMITLAGVWAILWRGPWRFAAAAPMALAFGLWGLTTRPDLLISSDGSLAGLMTPAGRALSAPRGAGFAAESWLQDDGDFTTQPDAATRPGFDGPKTARSFQLGDWRGVVLAGKAAPQAATAACAAFDLVILPASQLPPEPAPQGCVLIDRALLAKTGALSAGVADSTLTLTPARWAQRIWMGPKPVLEVRRFAKP